MSATRTISACFASVEAEPSKRREQIARAANEFRRMWKFSNGTIITTYPPLSELEAFQARRDAYNYSLIAGTTKATALYRDEVSAINRAEVEA